MKKAYSLVFLIFITLFIGGCGQISFYSQSILGHSTLMSKRQAVETILMETSDQALERQLKLSQRVLAFAHTELDLPKTKSYRSYVQLNRDFPVWNVVASSEFSLQAEQWCYLVIGCASYRGYFSQAAASRYAAKLQSKGLETHVGGAVAYSTLGWFRDPLLSSMFRYGDLYLAETLIHELAHQKLYINNHTTLNESFATVVAEEGMRRWLAVDAPQKLVEFENSKRADNDFAVLVQDLKLVLGDLYQSDTTLAVKRSAKQAVIRTFIDDYERLKARKWHGRGWYDNWMAKPINNARLAAYSSYQDYIPQLRALLDACNNNLNDFYLTVAQLKTKSASFEAGKDLPKNCHPR